MPVTVKFRLDFLVCGLQGKLLWNLAKSAPCFHVTRAMKQWRIVEIEFLAKVGWKWGCQPFSCPCSKNVPHCRKEICSTCLSKESMPCVKIQASTPYQKLEVPEICSTLHQLCIMVAPVASCLQKIELWYPRFGLQAIDCDPGCLRTTRLLQVNDSAADVLKIWLPGSGSCRFQTGRNAEKQRVWSRSYGLQDLLQCSDCALNCDMWLLQTNEQLSRLSF